MTLAEALMERAELKAKISAVSDRIEDNILVQDNEAPGEDPKELLPELSASIQRLRVLISQINKTNCSTLIDGESLTDLIARRDCLLLEISSYRDFTETSRRSTDRARGSEIKIRPCIKDAFVIRENTRRNLKKNTRNFSQRNIKTLSNM